VTLVVNEHQKQDVLREAFNASRSAFLGLAAFSFIINLLMLTGPVYMLQIYDRVLASQSVATLVVLSVLVTGLFIALGVLEFVRAGLLGRIAQSLDQNVGVTLFNASVERAVADVGVRSDQPFRDLRQLRQFLTSSVLTAMFDAPWTPVFLIVIWLMHWVLGIVAVLGGVVLVLFAIITELSSRELLQRSNGAAGRADVLSSAILRNAETVDALGMRGALRRQWENLFKESGANGLSAGDRLGVMSSLTRAFRLFLQSSMLGVGAYLAIHQDITPGVMVAASIILGRALAPIEQGVGQWRSIVSVRGAFSRLKSLLASSPVEEPHLPLPKALGALSVESLFAGPPGTQKPVLRNLSFALRPGEVLGIIGPSSAGKSTLARLIVGVWKPTAGCVRLDGADVATWSREELGPQLGYLPQEIELFSGSVAANVSRFELEPDPAAIVEAARFAGCHHMILGMPKGYETEIGEFGRHLSAGQRQRVGLARALYRKPALIVLDEPNANLDGAGDAELDLAIERMKSAGQTVIIIAHRPSAIARADKILVLEDGDIRAFGPRESVLRDLVRQSATSNEKREEVSA